jgi:hypothetical protein
MTESPKKPAEQSSSTISSARKPVPPARSNDGATNQKPTNKKVQQANARPDRDFRKYGIIFEADIQKKLKLKRQNPAAFKSSVRAQAIVAYSERSTEWMIACAEAAAKSIPQPFRDLWIAKDRKRKPNERLAAIERFARLFDNMPMNVGVALFDWLKGGSRNEVIKALQEGVVTLKSSPKTGDLIKVDGRGRKQRSETLERIKLAAQRRNDGVSERQMAAELFPNLLHEEDAYTRTRDFFLRNRYAIERMRHRLKNRAQSTRRSSH